MQVPIFEGSLKKNNGELEVSIICVDFTVYSWAGPEYDKVYFFDDIDKIKTTKKDNVVHITAEENKTDSERSSKSSLELDLNYDKNTVGDITKLYLESSGKYLSGYVAGKSYSYKLETGTIPYVDSSVWRGWMGKEKDGLKIITYKGSNDYGGEIQDFPYIQNDNNKVTVEITWK